MRGPGSEAYAVDPFGPAASPTTYVPFEASERARAQLERSLAQGRVAALVGPPGLGKTLILHLVRAREMERSRPVYIPFCTLDPDGFFALVLNLLGEPVSDSPREALLARARSLAERGGMLLLVDDAAALPEATAEALADVVFASAGSVGLAFAAVEGEAARRVCAAFGGRLDVVRLVQGMSEREAYHYVETRLAYAGARPDLVAAFDEETVAELHRESQGVPRRLNQGAQAVVRRAAPDALPRLAESFAPLPPAPAAAPEPEPEPAPAPAPEAEPQPAAAPGETPLPGPVDPAPFQGAGEYRLVRGRFVDPVTGQLPADTGVGPRPAPIPESEPGSEPASPPAGAAPPLPTPPRSARRRSRSWVLFAGGAAFAFAAGAAFVWLDARLPVDLSRLDVELPTPPGIVRSSPPVRVTPPAPESGPAAPTPPESAAAVPEASSGVAVAPEPTPEPTETAPPASAAPEPPSVSVSINATPWAVIEVDGREIGETPLAGIELAPGPHRFRARLPDGSTRERSVDVSPDRRTIVFQ